MFLMKNSLSSNIRLLRKSRKLTQEQLANALGVTIGAVSKWEVGTATPELGMLMSIARYFETSLDVLVGYELSGGTYEDALRRINEAMDLRGSRDSLLDAEKYLAKFPNRFDIVFSCAKLYATRGFELDDSVLMAKAVKLFERSLELIDQNSDRSVDSVFVGVYIAFLSIHLGNTEYAVKELKKSYRYGLNDELIGNLLAYAMDDPLSAEPYLSNGLSVTIAKLFHSCLGFAAVYIKKGEYKNSYDVAMWLHTTVSPLRPAKKSTYLDFIDVIALALCALSSYMLGNDAEARECFKECARLADLYDSEGSHSFEGVRYIDSPYRFSAIDHIARSAADSVPLILTNVKDKEEYSLLCEMWNEAKKEHSDVLLK